MAAPIKSSPRDAQVMTAILKDIGVINFEPRIINQMLEFAYRYVTDVLDDAKVYSLHANKKDLDKEDVKLAIQSKMDHTFTTPPPRELLMEVARQKNSQPLPLIRSYSGLRLPPDRYCLSAPNYKLKCLRKQSKPLTRAPLGINVTHVSSRFTGPVKQTPSRPNVTIQPTSLVAPTLRPTTPIMPTIKPIVRVNSGSSSNSSSMSSITDSSSSSVNPLKRKLEDSEDYDNN